MNGASVAIIGAISGAILSAGIWVGTIQADVTALEKRYDRDISRIEGKLDTILCNQGEESACTRTRR